MHSITPASPLCCIGTGKLALCSHDVSTMSLYQARLQPCIRDCFCLCSVSPCTLLCSQFWKLFVYGLTASCSKVYHCVVVAQMMLTSNNPTLFVIGSDYLLWDLAVRLFWQILYSKELCCKDMLTVLSTLSTGCTSTLPSLTNLSSPAAFSNPALPAKSNRVHHKNALLRVSASCSHVS